MRQALDGVRRVAERHGRLALDTEVLADLADAALAAVWTALGPVPELVWSLAVIDARRHRADLAAVDPTLVLAMPPGTALYPPAEVQRRRVARMLELGVPEVVIADERARLAILELAPAPAPAWDRVFVLRDHRARWPGYTRRGALSIEVARHVLPAWTGDDGPRRLLDDADDALRGACRAHHHDLRDQLSRRSFDVDGPANAALRAAVQAHDRVTQNPARDDQTELEYLAEQAWPGPVGEFAGWWAERVAACAAAPG